MTEITVPFSDRLQDVTLTAGQLTVDTDFPVIADADLVVIRVRAGATTTLTLTTDYTLADIGALGYKRITLATAALASDRLIILGGRAPARTSNLQSGELRSATFNAEFRSLVVILQELYRENQHAIKLAYGDDVSERVELPAKADRLGKYLRFNSVTGQPEVVVGTSDVVDFLVVDAVPDEEVGNEGDVAIVINAALDQHGNVYRRSGDIWHLQGNLRGPAGTGDVSGPGASTDNGVPRFDGTSGSDLQASGLVIDDNADATGLRHVAISGDATIASGSTDPTQPATNRLKLYGKAGVLHTIDESGTVIRLDGTPGVQRGYLSGLTLANNVTDAANDIDVAPGVCSDVDNVLNMTLSSTMTKRLDAVWAAGTGNGGLDSGSKANATWYHVFLIWRTDTGVPDVLISTSPTSPTMPASYDRKRRLGSVRTDGSGNILPFTQIGEQFFLTTPILDVDVTDLGTTSTAYTLSVPSGVVVEAIFNCNGTNAGSGWFVYIRPPFAADQAPSVTGSPLFTLFQAANVTAYASEVKKITNTSSQIYARSTAASTTLRIATLGWREFL